MLSEALFRKRPQTKEDSMKIQDILRHKGNKVEIIDEKQPVSEALRLLVTMKIGALVVINRRTRQVTGIISERDIVRGCYDKSGQVSRALVSELMTREVITCSPEDDINQIMATMTESRIRHLPVLEDGYLKGIVSIGDVVKVLLSETERENRSLKEYLYGAQQ